jgi:hypothetical protein
LDILKTVLRIRDVYPGSKNSNRREEYKEFVLVPFYVATNFTIENYFSFELLKKTIWANFQRLIELYPINCHKALKNMGLGSRIPGSKRHRIPDPDPQHCLKI